MFTYASSVVRNYDMIPIIVHGLEYYMVIKILTYRIVFLDISESGLKLIN